MENENNSEPPLKGLPDTGNNAVPETSGIAGDPTSQQAITFPDAATFDFLGTDAARKIFADADFALRQGRHIQNFGDDYKAWDFINEYFERGLAYYYEHLFGVYLRRGSNDRDVYYYLDFSEDSRGKFGYDRSAPLEGRHIVFGILLLNIYKEKFFEEKEVKWEELEYLIEESENKELWQKLLYGALKRNYTPNEKSEMKRKIKRTLSYFEKLGWIRWVHPEAVHFEIMPSIDRLAKLYEKEIRHVDIIMEYLSGENIETENNEVISKPNPIPGDQLNLN